MIQKIQYEFCVPTRAAPHPSVRITLVLERCGKDWEGPHARVRVSVPPLSMSSTGSTALPPATLQTLKPQPPAYYMQFLVTPYIFKWTFLQ